MTRILHLTDCATGGRERVAVYPHRMTLFRRDAWGDGEIIAQAAPRRTDGSVILRRLVHADDARSTLVEIPGDYLPDARHVGWLTLQVCDRSPGTLSATLHHWHGDPAHGDWAIAHTSFRMDASSRARWTTLTRWLQAQPDGRAALADFAL